MIELVCNQLEGKYASPKDHPVTCANPSPWKIIQMRIEQGYDRDAGTSIWKIWIRGEESMWFRADQCWIDTKEQLLAELSNAQVNRTTEGSKETQAQETGG